VRQLRERHWPGSTLEDIGEVTGIPVDRLASYERGEGSLTADELLRWAAALTAASEAFERDPVLDTLEEAVTPRLPRELVIAAVDKLIREAEQEESER